MAFDDTKVRSLVGQALGRIKTGLAAELATKLVRNRLYQLKKKHQWKLNLPPALEELPIVPSPIDLHCLSAYQTLKALRADLIDHFPALTEFEKIVGGATLTSYLQFRLALTCTLDAGIVDRWQISQCVFRVRQCRAPRLGMGLLLVPIRSNPDRIRDESVALGGASALAALALYEHLQKPPSEHQPFFSMDWFDAALEKVLAATHWVVHPAAEHTTADIFRRIVAFGQRLELPGYVWSSRDGSHPGASLPIHRMLSVLDDECYPADPVTRSAPKTSTRPRSNGKEVINAEHQLDQLIEIANFFADERSAETDQARRSGLVESLDNFTANTPDLALSSNLVVKMLGEWCLYLARDKKPEPIAPKTIQNRLHGIGKRLIKALNGRSLLDLESLELTHCLESVAKEKGDIRAKTHNERLGWIRGFHEFCSDQYDLAECEQSEILTMTSQDASIDPSIVTEREFQGVQTIFERWEGEVNACTFTNLTEPLTPHVIRSCRAMAILVFRVGLRPIEARRIRFCDLRKIRDSWYVYVRPSQYGPLKTLGSKRFLCLSTLLQPAELVFILSVRDESERFVGDRGHRTPVFCDPRLPSFPIERRVASALIGSALQSVTGDLRARAYWMRHGFAHYSAVLSALPESRGIDIATRLTQRSDTGTLPQRLQTASRLMGHVHRGTTFCYYFHLNDAAASYSATLRTERRATHFQAHIYGVTDNVFRQRLHIGRGQVRWDSASSVDLLCRSTAALSGVVTPKQELETISPPLPVIAVREFTLGVRSILELIRRLQKRELRCPPNFVFQGSMVIIET